MAKDLAHSAKFLPSCGYSRGLRAGQCVQNRSSEPSVFGSHDLRPLWELIVARRAGGWRSRSCVPRATWDKAASLLTRPEPSPPIFPPASVGAGMVSSVLSCAATGDPDWCTAFVPNDIFAINCDLRGRSVIPTWHNQWLPHCMRH